MLLRILSLLHTCALLFSMTAYAATLNEAIQTTLATNPDVLIAVHERLARDQALEQARGNYLPSVDVVADTGRERTDNLATRARTGGDVSLTRREIELQAVQRLFDGYETKHEVERQTARVESAAHSLVDVSERTALRVIDVYMEVLRRQELLRLSKQNLDQHLSIQDQIRLRAEAGVGRRSDVDQIDSRVALAKANVLADEFNLRDAETSYFRVVDEMPQDLTRPIAPTRAMPSSMSDAVTIAIANHPVLRVADADVEATMAQHKTARNTYYPQFDMQWTLGLGQDLDGIEGADDELSILLRARWNLYRGGRDRARLRETAFFIDQAKDVRDRARREVIESVRLSWVAHEAAMARLTPLKRRVVSTERTRDAYKKQFNIGQRALLDLLDTENEVTDAQRAYLNADVNGQIAQYRVFTGIGRLLETLEIPPPTNARVSDTLVAMSERTSSLIDTPTKPVIVAEETREMTDRPRPTLASGTETVGLTPVSIEHVAPYRAENGPRDKIQSAITFHPPTRPSFASVRRTLPRSYDGPQAKLAMDLSLLRYQSPPAVPATTALMVAMQDPRVDSAVLFEGSQSASRATSLNLDLRLPAQETKSVNLHLENLHLGGSQ